jgi:hypothetical protein
MARWPAKDHFFSPRRIVGTSLLVCSFAAVITYALAACILFLLLYE